MIRPLLELSTTYDDLSLSVLAQSNRAGSSETYISSIDLGKVRAGSLVRQSERLLTFRSGVQIPLGPL